MILIATIQYFMLVRSMSFLEEKNRSVNCVASRNLRWRSSSDNGKDSRSEDHKEFEETVPLVNICQYFNNLSKEEKKEKLVLK